MLTNKTRRSHIFMLLLQTAAVISTALLSVRKPATYLPAIGVRAAFTMSSRSKSTAQREQHCEYVIANDSGRYVRHVKPYFQEFRTFAKGRWIGREVIEVFCREFGAHPPSYWINALRNGQVRINGRIVSADYKFKNSDALLHRAHRHEPPVFGEVVLVGETEEIVAVSKPPSLPMHPCGAYRHNSLEYILKREHLVPNQPTLSVVHRLDRVTSGLVVLAKSKSAAAQISQEIRDKATMKVYLARVKGKFPRTVSDATVGNIMMHLRQLPSIDLEEFADETEDYEMNGFSDEVGSKKRPINDIEEPDRSTAVTGVDTSDTALNTEKSHSGSKNNKRSKKRDTFGKGDNINVEDLPPRVRPVMSLETVGQAENVGVLFSVPVCDALEQGNNKRSGVIQAIASGDLSTNKEVKMTQEAQEVQEVWVKCPLGVVSQRDGIHACDPSGKPSLSIFKSLGYDAETDTSLVECRPYTGRTHQLRLHLQLLGFPIANDPCYGGVLFYGDDARRTRAVEAVKEMRNQGIIPLSKVPHFGDPEVDSLLLSSAGVQCGDSCTAEVPVTSESAPVLSENEITAPLEGESEDDYLVRTCRYCAENSSVELEHLLHCDGIWLHALRYTGPPVTVARPSTQAQASVKADDSNTVTETLVQVAAVGKGGRRWSFQAPYPSWAAPFILTN